jgi:hypothetical protein
LNPLILSVLKALILSLSKDRGPSCQEILDPLTGSG